MAALHTSTDTTPTPTSTSTMRKQPAAALSKVFTVKQLLALLIILGQHNVQLSQAIELGAKCQHNMDCTDFIKGSACSTQGYCECEPYFVQLNATQCLQSHLLGGDCVLNEQCTMKVANSSCLDGACRCVEGFLQFRKHTCVGPAHPGAVCYSHAHCQMFDTRTHCEFLIPNLFGRCQCTAPARMVGGLCLAPEATSTAAAEVAAEASATPIEKVEVLPATPSTTTTTTSTTSTTTTTTTSTTTPRPITTTTTTTTTAAPLQDELAVSVEEQTLEEDDGQALKQQPQAPELDNGEKLEAVDMAHEETELTQQQEQKEKEKQHEKEQEEKQQQQVEEQQQQHESIASSTATQELLTPADVVTEALSELNESDTEGVPADDYPYKIEEEYNEEHEAQHEADHAEAAETGNEADDELEASGSPEMAAESIDNTMKFDYETAQEEHEEQQKQHQQHQQVEADTEPTAVEPEEAATQNYQEQEPVEAEENQQVDDELIPVHNGGNGQDKHEAENESVTNVTQLETEPVEKLENLGDEDAEEQSGDHEMPIQEQAQQVAMATEQPAVETQQADVTIAYDEDQLDNDGEEEEKKELTESMPEENAQTTEPAKFDEETNRPSESIEVNQAEQNKNKIEDANAQLKEELKQHANENENEQVKEQEVNVNEQQNAEKEEEQQQQQQLANENEKAHEIQNEIDQAELSADIKPPSGEDDLNEVNQLNQETEQVAQQAILATEQHQPNKEISKSDQEMQPTQINAEEKVEQQPAQDDGQTLAIAEHEEAAADGTITEPKKIDVDVANQEITYPTNDDKLAPEHVDEPAKPEVVPAEISYAEEEEEAVQTTTTEQAALENANVIKTPEVSETIVTPEATEAVIEDEQSPKTEQQQPEMGIANDEVSHVIADDEGVVVPIKHDEEVQQTTEADALTEANETEADTDVEREEETTEAAVPLAEAVTKPSESAEQQQEPEQPQQLKDETEIYKNENDNIIQGAEPNVEQQTSAAQDAPPEQIAEVETKPVEEAASATTATTETPVTELDYTSIEKLQHIDEDETDQEAVETEDTATTEKVEHEVQPELTPNVSEELDKDDNFKESQSIADILSDLMAEDEGTVPPVPFGEQPVATLPQMAYIPDLLAEETQSAESIAETGPEIATETVVQGATYTEKVAEQTAEKQAEVKAEAITVPVESTTTALADVEATTERTLSPEELPFDLSDHSSHRVTELESDSLIVESTTLDTLLDNNNHIEHGTEAPVVAEQFQSSSEEATPNPADIVEITTQTMLGLASRVTLMEPAAPVVTTLMPLMIADDATPEPSKETLLTTKASTEQRKRVDLGLEAISLGLPCASDHQCQLADSHTVCNARGVCDCAFKDETTADQCSAQRTGCSPGTFQCRSSGVCISWFFVCDGRADCTDNSDEECTHNARRNQTCPTESFLCERSGRCISRAALCDGRKQCPHGEDELSCGGNSRSGNCPPHTFRCNSGECLPEYEYCNAIVSCKDGSDEPPHMCGSRSVPRMFMRLIEGGGLLGSPRETGAYCPHRCSNGLCRSTAIVCSGRDGCGDGTDEQTCAVCRCPAPTSANLPAFIARHRPMPLW